MHVTQVAFRSLTLILLVSTTGQAHTAGSPPLSATERAFSEEGWRILEDVIQNHTTTIGDFDLRKLQSIAKSIDWRVRAQGPMAGSGENRQTAEHLIEQRQVTMSRENLRIIPWRTRPMVSLHETFGALGIEDEAYQRTLGFFIYAYLEKDLLDPRKFPSGFREVIAAQFNSIELRTRNPVYQLALGGTSVGSGGDGTALDFKLALLLFGHPLLMKFPELFSGNSLDLLTKVLAARIEIHSDTSITATTFTKKDGKTVVRISGEKWRNGYRQPDANPISLSQWQMLLDTLRQFEVYK